MFTVLVVQVVQDKKGNAISFVSREEELTLVQIERLINQRIHRVQLEGYEPKSREALVERMNTKAAYRDRARRQNNPTQDQSAAERRARLRKAISSKATKITRLKK